MRAAVAVVVTLERPPHVPPQENLALDGAHSALHQVGPQTTPWSHVSRLVPRCCLPAQFLLDLCSHFLPLSCSMCAVFPLPCHPLSILCPTVPLSLALCQAPGEETYLACCTCPKVSSALLLHPVVAPSGLLAPTYPVHLPPRALGYLCHHLPTGPSPG